MSNHLPAESTQKEAHGSVQSYTIGFGLSLLLTIIPYYMVTREIISGSALLLSLLGLGVLQMFVQIYFFLHLGRGPKPLYNIVFFFATAGLIVLVISASILIMNNLYHNMSPHEVTTRLAQEENIDEVGGQATGACQGNSQNHVVTIQGNEVMPSETEAKRCDTLTLSIEDGIERELVFSKNGSPASYGGFYEVTVRSDRSKIITLNEIGEFDFNDGLDAATSGRFLVRP